MRKKYVIQWKSKVNGRAGKGTKLFDLQQAEALATELNEGYPDIEHEVLDVEASAGGSANLSPPNSERETQGEQEAISQNPATILSLAG
jgi:hypothetical protein